MKNNVRWFKGDKWTDQLGSLIPLGSEVKVISFFRGRRALVEYMGNYYLTMTWCLSKIRPTQQQLYLIVERRKREFERVYHAISH